MLHLLLHFLIPGLVAVAAYRHRFWVAYAWLMAGMIIDLDHLWAEPIYDATRCSVGFHPLHTGLFILGYLMLMAHPKTRLLGIGLCIHIVLDSIDCQVTNGVWFVLS